jgi:hypothetical protein
MSDSNTNTVTTKVQTQCTSRPLPKRLPVWNTLNSLEELKTGDVVLHEGQLAKVTFTNQRYVVITPKDMQYGILVYPEFLHRVKFLS